MTERDPHPAAAMNEPHVEPCDVCEMGLGTHPWTSKQGKPLNVICNACLDNEVRYDPRGIRDLQPAASPDAGKQQDGAERLKRRHDQREKNEEALRLAVNALSAASISGDFASYGKWDCAKWDVFNAAVRFVKEPDPAAGKRKKTVFAEFFGSCHHCGVISKRIVCPACFRERDSGIKPLRNTSDGPKEKHDGCQSETATATDRQTGQHRSGPARERVENYERADGTAETARRSKDSSVAALPAHQERTEPQVFWHRCSGCGLRWSATEAGSVAAELCGDCWRKVRPFLHSAPARAAHQEIPASDFGLEPEMQPVVDELRRRMNAAGATDSSHIAAVITRLMPFVQHTDACVGARSRSACECGAARAMEDAKNIATALSTADPEAAPAHQEESETVANLRERMRWYRDGCPDLEDTPVYFVSGDCARDAAGDLETALGEIERLTKGAPARAAEWQPLLDQMRICNEQINAAATPEAYHSCLVALAIATREFLRRLPPCALTGKEEAS